MGQLSKHGTHPGSFALAVIIGPISVPPGFKHAITHFKTMMETSSLNGLFLLEKSNDGFAMNIVELDSSVMPTNGTFEDSTVGATVGPGEAWRVRFSQTDFGRVKVTVRGTVLTSAGSPDAPDDQD